MAGEGYGTTSIGTGSAQVVGSPSFDLTKLAQPLIQQQKDKVAKAAAKTKTQERILGDIGKIKTIASPRYQAFIEAGKKDIIEKTKKFLLTDDVSDRMALDEAQRKLHTIIDGAKKTDALYGGIGKEMMQGGNYWNKENFDNYYQPLPTEDLSFDAFMKQLTDDTNKAVDIAKDKHNPMAWVNKMEGTAKTFYGTQGDFTEDDLRDSLTTLFTRDPDSFDTFRHYKMDAEKDQKLLDQFGGDATQAAIDLAYNDFLPLVGKKPKGKGSTFNFFAGGNNAAPNSASVFNGNTVFGKGDTSFVQENQPAASFPVKSTIASPDPDTFDPVSFKKLSSGAVNNVQYGSMIVSDTLDQDLDFGGGYVIPKGTPIPQGKSMGDIALMYFGQQAGFDKDKLELLKKTPEYKAYSTRKPKTTIGLFAVGAGKDGDGDEMSVYTPLQKVWGAIQGGLSKDDEGKLNMQGKIIYDEYIKKGGKPFSIVGVTESDKPAGGDKRNSALLYTFNGKDWSLDQLITKYGSEENAKKAIAKFGFKQKK
jgi:hypothetical protein